MPAFAKPSLKAFVNSDCCCLADQDRGFVVGTLFPRHGIAEQIVSSSSLDWEAFARSAGDILFQSFWGGYVAAIVDSGGITVTRDPSATLACYFVRRRDLVAFASDAELLVQASFADGAIDWKGLTRDFFSAGVPTHRPRFSRSRNCFPAFDCDGLGLASSNRAGRPGISCAQLPGRRPASERLARSVKHSIAAWAKNRGPLLLSLSGGLNSSIVACSLAAARAETFCLTMYDEEDPGGDERAYARALSAHLDLPLIERPYGSMRSIFKNRSRRICQEPRIEPRRSLMNAPISKWRTRSAPTRS